jgi:GT2 family glycosyltransferase
LAPAGRLIVSNALSKEQQQIAVAEKRHSRLRVSVVCFASDESELKKTLATLLDACKQSLQRTRLAGIDICLVDNGPTAAERGKIDALITFFSPTISSSIRLLRCGSGRNIGFGAGHNLVLDISASEFHLVLNPDVELATESLQAAIDFMDANTDCGILVPAIASQNGEPQYLCKRYPNVLDLLLRGFAPSWLRTVFKQRLADYEMRDVIANNTVWQPPIVSGCFMLLRSSVLSKLRGFDTKYFLYFEDFDLSLRAAALTRIAYVPAVRVMHHGGHAARKGWRHIYLFIRSAIIFFNSHGWKWC